MDTVKPTGRKWLSGNLRKYGLTLGAYDRLLTSQAGTCAICREYPTAPTFRLCVDHCHATGKVRGLLCRNCNAALGMLKDDALRARLAADYLERSTVH